MKHCNGRLLRWTAGVILCATAFSVKVQAEIRLPKLLNSHGVWQRERPLHVWGWADPNEAIMVSFHQQTGMVKADELGRWSLWLKPESAGGPYTLTVKGSNESVTSSDILMGDVWFASGQSNMEMPLRGFPGAAKVVDDEKEIAAAKHPKLRLLVVARKTSDYPVTDISGEWAECTPDTAKEFSAVAYFFGREILEKENVPVGLIDSAWGGTPIESWTSLDGIASDSSLMPIFAARAHFAANLSEVELKRQQEQRELELAIKEGRPKPQTVWRPDDVAWLPGFLYNGMVAPVTPFPVRGFLWYQGEANADSERAPFYGRQLSLLINDWRAKWNQGALPFFYVQLSNNTPGGDGWGWVREGQRRALSVANTGIAVAHDVGEGENIHPGNKQAVGHRLALAAEALSYKNDAEYSGPAYQSAIVEEGSIRLWFDHAKGLTSHGPLKGFEISDEKGHFVPAEAVIEGESVVVRSAEVAHPKWVRYAWSALPDATLYNSANLPTATFTTQD